MAKHRAARQEDSPIRFGRGRAPTSVAGQAQRVGMKDANARRSKVFGIRVTEAQEAAIRDAFAKGGAGQTIGMFAADLLLDAISGRSMAPAFLAPAAAADPAELLKKVDVLARHQKGLQARIEGTMASVDNLAQGLGAVSARLDGLGDQLSALLRALEETGRRKPTAGGGPDLFTQKHS